MIFNGISKDFLRVREGLFRPPSPPIEFDIYTSPTGGSRVSRKQFTGFSFSVPIKISSPDRRIEELKEELADWLIHDEPKKLGFKDIPNRYYLAYYESMDLDERPYSATGEIVFYLPDGCRMGEERTFNLTKNNTTHEIGGKVKTPWTIEIIFEEDTDKFELISENTDLFLLLGYQFQIGDRLKIAYTGRICELNGRDIRFAIRLASNFTMLSPGSLVIKASHECKLIYDERFY